MILSAGKGGGKGKPSLKNSKGKGEGKGSGGTKQASSGFGPPPGKTSDKKAGASHNHDCYVSSPVSVELQVSFDTCSWPACAVGTRPCAITLDYIVNTVLTISIHYCCRMSSARPKWRKPQGKGLPYLKKVYQATFIAHLLIDASSWSRLAPRLLHISRLVIP